MAMKRFIILTLIVATVLIKSTLTQSNSNNDDIENEIIDSDVFERQALIDLSDSDVNLIDDEDDEILDRKKILYPKLNKYKPSKKLLFKKVKYPLTSPYQVIPGTYRLTNNQYYGYNNKSNRYDLNDIYSDYLIIPPNNYYSLYKNCSNTYGYGKQITQNDLYKAFAYANALLTKRYPYYSNVSSYNNVDHKEIEGIIMELASEYFSKYGCLSKYQMAIYLPTIPVSNQYFYLNKQGDRSCLPFWNEKYQCYSISKNKYRSIDGSCNNLRSPYWGRSMSCHIRLLPPDYGDGLKEFRLAKNGYSLPSPRSISNYIALNRELKSYYTAMIIAWGQFLNHDITNTANFKMSDDVDCCKRLDARCAAIMTDTVNDYMRDNFQTNCMNFVRSQPCPLCKMGPREQMNTVTSFIDGSTIYGSTIKVSNSLRSFQKGQLLAVSDAKGNPILPFDPAVKPCQPSRAGISCFKAGDDRVNQQPILLTMHTIWLRNHNNHAIRLSLINPHWNDERLFQEARRITIAEIQHITYNEYLPIILGPLLMDYYRLYSKQDGYSQYESFTDPSTWNEFISAASRYGHSQIKNLFALTFALTNRSHFALKDSFLDPTFHHNGLTEEIARGLVGEFANTVDPYYSDVVKQFIMKQKIRPHGIDLVAFNIQRGRDHGIPGYVHYLKACFNFHAKTWKDLAKFIPMETLMKLKKIYQHIEDIDLYIGGVSERHFIDSNIGPTFGCLVGIQYYHLKYGDRYFYEHYGQSGSFNQLQLRSIKQSATLSRIICRNLIQQQYIQSKPFYYPSRLNPQIDCNKFADIDYLLWKE